MPNNDYLDYISNTIYDYDDYLEHYGIKGMHWGKLRFQNEDGSLTALGRLRYGVGKDGRSTKNKTSNLLTNTRTIATKATNYLNLKTSKNKSAAMLENAARTQKKNKLNSETMAKANANANANKMRSNIREATVKINKSIQKVNDFNDKVANKVNKGLNNIVSKLSKASKAVKIYIKGDAEDRRNIRDKVLKNSKVASKIHNVYVNGKIKSNRANRKISDVVGEAYEKAMIKFGDLMESGKGLITSVKSSGKTYTDKVLSEVEQVAMNTFISAGVKLDSAEKWVDNMINTLEDNMEDREIRKKAKTSSQNSINDRMGNIG